MPCDTIRKPRQSQIERDADIKRAKERLSQGLASGRIKAKVGPQGAVAFIGFEGADRDGVTDVCGYRYIMVHGSALARAAITRAEQMAGRTVDRNAQVHSHDGGTTWSPNH